MVKKSQLFHLSTRFIAVDIGNVHYHRMMREKVLSVNVYLKTSHCTVTIAEYPILR